MNRYPVLAVMSAVLFLSSAPASAQSAPAGCDSSACAVSGNSCGQPCQQCCPPPKPVYRGPSPYSKLKAEVAALKKRLDELEQQVCTKPCNDDAIAALQADLIKANRAIDDLGQEAAKGRKKAEQQDAQLAGLTEKLALIDVRLQVLEQRPKSPLTIGPAIGGIALWSPGCSDYYGFLIGPRLGYRIDDSLSLNLDLDLALGTGSSPYGAKVRGGVGYRLTEMFTLEAGANALWTDIDSGARATSLFILGDIGVRLDLWKAFVAAHGLLGAETGACGTCFAGGLMLRAGIMFP